MLVNKKFLKKNPLSKAQNKLLQASLQKLLGKGLLDGPDKNSQDAKSLVLKNALNAIVLDN